MENRADTKKNEEIKYEKEICVENRNEIKKNLRITRWILLLGIPLITILFIILNYFNIAIPYLWYIYAIIVILLSIFSIYFIMDSTTEFNNSECITDPKIALKILRGARKIKSTEKAEKEREKEI